MFTVRDGLIMGTRCKRGAIRLVAALLLAVGLGGCVYDPYYSSYPYYSYYPGYGYPTYVGPPVSLSFGYYKHSHHGHHGGHHGGYRHGGGHGHGRH